MICKYCKQEIKNKEELKEHKVKEGNLIEVQSFHYLCFLKRDFK